MGSRSRPIKFYGNFPMIEDLTELFNFGKIAYVVKQFTISYLCVHCFCILQVQFYFLYTNMEKYFL